MIDKTVLPVGSLTKGVVAAVMGILVKHEKANWSTLVKDVLPSSNIKAEILQNYTTVIDLLCHRTDFSDWKTFGSAAMAIF